MGGELNTFPFSEGMPGVVKEIRQNEFEGHKYY
jgi:hypothetical protein